MVNKASFWNFSIYYKTSGIYIMGENKSNNLKELKHVSCASMILSCPMRRGPSRTGKNWT